MGSSVEPWGTTEKILSNPLHVLLMRTHSVYDSKYKNVCKVFSYASNQKPSKDPLTFLPLFYYCLNVVPILPEPLVKLVM